ncbi:MAG: RNHCP domain-containing protein [Patescibacteria group bacterium]
MKRKIEDFKCDVCGTSVTGNGYTNHCPACLWSKHVDNDPGDRESDCGGMMKPVGVEVKHGEIIRVAHKCQKCGFERPAPVTPKDNTDELIRISVQDLRS